MVILGISSYYHDSAAALVIDGKVVCAFEEERFTRVKHDNSFPENAVQACLAHAHLTHKDIDLIAYYEKPALRFERVLDRFIDTYPNSLEAFSRHIPEWLSYKLNVRGTIYTVLNYEKEIIFVPHHLSHAAATYYPSPFQKAAILTIDGVGEYMTTGLWCGENDSITLLKSIEYPHSLGLLYSTFTAFLGFKVNEGEYKMMGLAAYGTARYVDEIYELITVNDDGSFKLDMRYFSFEGTSEMWTPQFETLFDEPHTPYTEFSQKHKDIAASIQTVTEEIYQKLLTHLRETTNSKNVCVGGGVALNSLANGKVIAAAGFESGYIFGPSGDSGSAVGAALWCAIKNSEKRIPITNLLLGNNYDSHSIKQTLDNGNTRYTKVAEADLSKKIAQRLEKESIIGLFQSRSEFGPRALGARSILANPTNFETKTKLNTLKKRESFRPFAISILEEYLDEVFELPTTQTHYPFMNHCFVVREEWRDRIPAAVHADGTCRVQTVTKDDGLYYEILHSFYTATGIPCVINTSFNVAGEPIVNSPEEALNAFKLLSLDHLFLEHYEVHGSSSG